ncbi:phospholipase A2 [Tsukamurella pulmonis]|uniref:phospholipase A2 n=1 Tax=Tsukamurella pulmonis TaxID=47312 RepID=UPI001058AC26|nr:phospholipase A2 [Tsukamurella pulmonis]
MPTPDNPNGCIVNCGPTPTQAPPTTATAPTAGTQPAESSPAPTQQPENLRSSDKCRDARIEFGIVSGHGGAGRSVPILRDPVSSSFTNCDCSDAAPAQVQYKAADPVTFDSECDPFKYGDRAWHVGTMPCGYIYDPDSKITPEKDVARHDYCTSSPDSFPGGNLRPICARHDMCMDEMDRLGLQGSEGAFKYRTCNNILHEEFKEYCGSKDWKTRYQCRVTADIYYLAITGTHLNF